MHYKKYNRRCWRRYSILLGSFFLFAPFGLVLRRPVCHPELISDISPFLPVPPDHMTGSRCASTRSLRRLATSTGARSYDSGQPFQHKTPQLVNVDENSNFANFFKTLVVLI